MNKIQDIKGNMIFTLQQNPGVFVQTNVNGTFTLISINLFLIKKNCRFSTDGTLSLDPNDLFTENTPYAPNSASSDMIIRAYNETYGLNTVITNYGPKQHDEKLIPTIIRNALKGNIW